MTERMHSASATTTIAGAGVATPVSTHRTGDYRERVCSIECDGSRLLGILAEPVSAAARSHAVVIAVGGPQYRVGSHRQFVLLARRLAASGYPSLRFDFRGMGDSDGAPRSFEAVDDDIRAAVQALRRDCPQVTSISLWGLCDAASAIAIAMTHSRDAPIDSAILLNPWVRHEASLASARIKHYYRDRLLSAEFWRKTCAGAVDWRQAARDVRGALLAVVGRRRRPRSDSPTRPFQVRMADGLRHFDGRVLIVLSERDLTAQEFADFTRNDPAWRKVLSGSNVSTCKIAGADHTFSSAAWRAQVEALTLEHLNRLSEGK